MNSLEHPDNDHWQAWREAVARTGYTTNLSYAATILEALLERMTPEQFEQRYANMYRNLP
jgi:hypothetical protein